MSGIIDCEMHIGDEVFVHGYIDEIRNDTIIIRNVGGYFGTSRDEVFYYEEDGTLNADRKTEPNSSEIPNNCETCKWGEWYRQGYDITMMDDECGGCCSWNSKWTPKDKPTGYNLSPVEDEPQTCSVNGRPYSECGRCEFFRCGADEPQAERSSE